MTTFPAVLTRLRESAGLSQSALARYAGINVSTVCRLEMQGDDQSNRVPSRALVGKLCDALDLTACQRIELYAAAGFIPDGLVYMIVETHGLATLIAQEHAALGEGRDIARARDRKREAA